MPSFRSSAAQASHAVSQRMAEGASRSDTRDTSEISSYGTARGYAAALTVASNWAKDEGLRGGLSQFDRELADRYLEARSTEVCQKTLDLDRQALQSYLAEKIDRVFAERTSGQHGEASRAYTPQQVEAIKAEMSERNALSTQIAQEAGLRAAELHTLARVDERPADTHREWSEGRFTGREDHVRYTVEGKGGLCREVAMSRETADKLEACRRNEPVTVLDRGIRIESRYDIAGGQPLSNAFSAASNEALDRSNGFHGLRHEFAQERMEELQSLGLNYQEALGTVSQEMGHFREDITETYLR